MMSPASSVAIPDEARKPANAAPYYALFFASGFPALLYQIVWQRSLFTIYGVNIQSVTVIVTVFMLGLGLGSLAGGRLSALPGLNVLRAFGLIELGIGSFGAFSLILFHYVERFTAGASTSSTAIVTFLLLLIPTLLMGSTLPLLVEYLVRETENVGESVGSLYSVNTFGSAVACFVASAYLMRALGQSRSIHAAAAINGVVGISALVLSLRTSAGKTKLPGDAALDQRRHRTISVASGMLMAGSAGFIALAYEILWYHIYSFTSGGRAFCFAVLLGCYLVGIACGSLWVQDLCRNKLRNDLPQTLRTAAKVVCIGLVLAFVVIPATAFCVSRLKFPYVVTFAFIAIAAGVLGAAFPVIAHASINPDDQAGRKLSYLYLSNIIGSALGSFTIGFVAMDYLSTEQLSVVLLILGSLVSLWLAMLARPLPVGGVLSFALTGTFLLVLGSPQLFSRLYERLMYRSDYRPDTVFREVLENRNGAIAVDSDEVVYGGGIYDGAFRIDPLNDTNNIFRGFAVAAIHPNPRHVMLIGLSSGSWAQVLVHDPRVQEATIVEINPGYLPLIKERPIVASLLRNPNVHIAIDDGRRWLVAHPNAKFDFILMNTTFHWRANNTNLLSVEFLQLARKHLNPGGVLYYNTTNSARVQFTAATVFPFALRIANFIAVSDSPIQFDRETFRKILESYQIDGRQVFDLSNPDDQRCIDRWVSMPEAEQKSRGEQFEATIEDRTSLMRRFQNQLLITDDNMGTEWW